MADPLRESLSGLVEDGTLSAEQAERVEHVLRERGVAPHMRSEPTTTRRERAGEVLSYVGGALVIGALLLLVSLTWDELSKPGRIAICATATVLLLGAAFGLAARSGATRRPAAISTVAALGAVAAAITTWVALEVDRSWPPGLVLLLVSAAAYALWRGSPLVVAVFAGGLLILLDILDNVPESWGELRTHGIGFVLYGALWIVLDRIRRGGLAGSSPMAGVLGGALAVLGAEVGAFDERYPAIGLAVGAVVILSLFGLFWYGRDWTYAALGVLAALIVPSTALGRIWENALVGGVVLLIVGVCLVIGSIFAVRQGRTPAND
ncbi:DUF2157 domain-containing protein [Flindersiella endophytica]